MSVRIPSKEITLESSIAITVLVIDASMEWSSRVLQY